MVEFSTHAHRRLRFACPAAATQRRRHYAYFDLPVHVKLFFLHFSAAVSGCESRSCFLVSGEGCIWVLRLT